MLLDYGRCLLSSICNPLAHVLHSPCDPPLYTHLPLLHLALLLPQLVTYGECGAAGSWLVEGIGEDFVPPVLDLSIVR